VNARMGDRFARADIEETHVRCNDNVDCCFEGDAEVEWLSTTEADWTCRCGLHQIHEVD
jgi:hypothetical protein